MVKSAEKKVALSITCRICGEPINKTSVDFGMDCKNDCGRKAEARGEAGTTLVFGAKEG